MGEIPFPSSVGTGALRPDNPLPGSALEQAQIAVLEAERRKLEAEVVRYDLANEQMRWDNANLAAGSDQVLKYTFYNPIHAMTVVEAMMTLDRWSRRSPGAPIEIVLNSPGGTANDGFAFYDFIRLLQQRGHKVTTTCLGQAASMGAILMQVGDERVMTKNSFMMVHKIQSKMEGALDDLTDTMKMLERIQEKALQILTARSKMSREELSMRWTKTDWYLDAEEALELGFVDRIV